MEGPPPPLAAPAVHQHPRQGGQGRVSATRRHEYPRRREPREPRVNAAGTLGTLSGRDHYEYPFPDDADLPCCVPPRAATPALGALGPAVDKDVVGDEDRDPHRINQHIQILWEDVVAEPDGVRSHDVSWRGSARLFRLTRDLVYATLTCVLGPPVAVVLGCGFAVIAFLYIWCVSPVLRACRLSLGALNTLLRAVTHSTVAPVTEALGLVCNNIRVRVQSGPAGQGAADVQPLLA